MVGVEDEKLYDASKQIVSGFGDDLGALFQEFTLWNFGCEALQYSEGDTFPQVNNFIAEVKTDGLFTTK